MDKALAARRSLLEDMDMPFRLDTTWARSSWLCEREAIHYSVISVSKRISFPKYSSSIRLEMKEPGADPDPEYHTVLLTRPSGPLYRGLSSHLHTSFQEGAEVLSKSTGGSSQVLRGSSRGLHQFCGCLI